MLWSLVLLAPFSLLVSDLPRPVAWTLALLAVGWAVIDARRYRSMPVRRLSIPAGRALASCDDARIDCLKLAWRGPLAFLSWRDMAGRRHRASFWPDTLDAGMRRELRIAMLRREAASDGASVAG